MFQKILRFMLLLNCLTFRLQKSQIFLRSWKIRMFSRLMKEQEEVTKESHVEEESQCERRCHLTLVTNQKEVEDTHV